MTERPQQPDCADSARDHDDRDLIEGMDDAPSDQGSAGGRLQRDVGSQDDETRATDPDAGLTRVRKDDAEQRPVPTRSDDQGAQD